MNDLQIVTTPTFDWLAERARACKSRMLVGSPYVNKGILKLSDMVSDGVTRTLVTRTDLRDFALGSSSLGTLCTLAGQGVAVHSLHGLHAKIYVFDDTSALVTSANATNAGMRRNLECGLGTGDSQVVQDLADSLLSGFGAEEPPPKVSHIELQALYAPLETIRAKLPELPLIPQEVDSPVEATFSISDKDALLNGFDRWQRLTLEGVLKMPIEGFHMTDLLKVCEPVAAVRYPGNNTVRPQLRKQLQSLRDLGIVEFMGGGHYRFTMETGQAEGE